MKPQFEQGFNAEANLVVVFPVGACSVIPRTPVGQFGEITRIFSVDFRESG